jgi:hypothetical protein
MMARAAITVGAQLRWAGVSRRRHTFDAVGQPIARITTP